MKKPQGFSTVRRWYRQSLGQETRTLLSGLTTAAICAGLTVGCGKALTITVDPNGVAQTASQQTTGTVYPVNIVVPAVPMSFPTNHPTADTPFMHPNGASCVGGVPAGVRTFRVNPLGTNASPTFAPSYSPETQPCAGASPINTDSQTPAEFPFTYPSANFFFSKATMIIDTSRDTTDTEGILVGGDDGTGKKGVLTGRAPNLAVQGCKVSPNVPPPAGTTPVPAPSPWPVGSGTPNPWPGGTSEYNTGCATSPWIKYDHSYSSASQPTKNTYYIDYSLQNYMPALAQADFSKHVNTFNLDVQQLLDPSPMKAEDVVKSGKVFAILTDDSPMFKGNLIINGNTVSTSPLTCTTSPDYTFQNVLVHHDGNSLTGSPPAFSGVVGNPGLSTTHVFGTYGSVEFYFNPQLPKVNLTNITMQSAWLQMRLRRTSSAPVAIVINGVGISQAGFDRTQAIASPNPSPVVESWDDRPAVVAALDAFVNSIPIQSVSPSPLPSVTAQAPKEPVYTLNLYTGSSPNPAYPYFPNPTPTVSPAPSLRPESLFTATEVRDLINQGSLNFVIAGGIQAVSSMGTNGALPISANRTFGTQVFGPTFIMSGTYNTEICQIPTGTVGGGSGAPEITNVAVTDTLLGSTEATITWLTTVPATTELLYGLGPVATSPGTDPLFGAVTETTGLDSTLTTGVHTVHLTGLLPYRFYNFRPKSTNSDGSFVSRQSSFRTKR